MHPFFLLLSGNSIESAGGVGRWACFRNARTRGSGHRRGWRVPRARENRLTQGVSLSVCFRDKKTPGFNGDLFLPYLFLLRVRDHPPRRGPGPPLVGTARAVRLSCCLDGRRDRAAILLSSRSPTPMTLALTYNPNAGLSLRFLLCVPPWRLPTLLSMERPTFTYRPCYHAPRKPGHGLNWHKDLHLFK